MFPSYSYLAPKIRSVNPILLRETLAQSIHSASRGVQTYKRLAPLSAEIVRKILLSHSCRERSSFIAALVGRSSAA